MIWSCCYDIGLIYCFVPKTKFNEISIKIRKVVKQAGLDQLTPKDVIYKVSTRFPPEIMATKQILQLGLKMANFEELGENRFLMKPKPGDSSKPFWSTFCHEFNALPSENRKYIHENYTKDDPGSVNKVKNHLKVFFMKREKTNLKKPEILKLVKKFKYSRAKVDSRILQAKVISEKRCHSTPTGQRSRIRSISNMRTLTAKNTRAPFRTTYPENLQWGAASPPRKVAKSSQNTTPASKRTREPATPSSRKRRRMQIDQSSAT